MNLIHYTPASLFNGVFDRMFEDYVGNNVAPEGAKPASGFVPRVDIRELENAIVLKAELPGVSKDQISIQVENNVLVLSGEKLSEHTGEENGVYRSERSYGSFSRSFRLPDLVDGQKIEAGYENGLLTLVLPKRPEAAARKIEIQAKDVTKKIGIK